MGETDDVRYRSGRGKGGPLRLEISEPPAMNSRLAAALADLIRSALEGRRQEPAA